MITIREETMSALAEYGKVSIAFMVESRYVATPKEGDGGGRLTEEAVDSPWVKDYDGGEPPTRWLRWDTTNWRILSAFAGEKRVGGAIVVHDSPELNFLEGRRDLAALWDIRVAPEWRGQGVGTMLFKRVVSYAQNVGCVDLKIETQDINVKACDFYAKQGCWLVNVVPDAYPGLPEEVEFNWMLEFRPDV
ncbi:MAG: GNAT family N-acetyltransferase [Chloroflexi bacterium]|nr:GNAT family N-acetyltransferase [Chloroflexota bacterium]